MRPTVPHFSSGPCAKRPGWTPQALNDAALGRSHRSKIGKAKLKRAIDLTREVLQVPADYRIGIVPASDTGAVEMALWSLLGARPVDVLAWESLRRRLGHRRRQGAQAQRRTRARRPPMANCPTSPRSIRPATSSSPGTAPPRACALPNADWIAADRTGLTICDATSAAFAQPLDWAKLDVVTFSWQKALGGEAAHGMLILSPRAVARLESYTPPWPLPKIFRMTKGGKLIEGIFQGETINTPSMLCVEDYLDALEWAKSIGGLTALRRARRRQRQGRSPIGSRARRGSTFSPAIRRRAPTPSVCLKVVDPAVTALAGRGPGGVRQGHRRARSRRKASPTTSAPIATRRPACASGAARRSRSADVEALTLWLDWAYAKAKAKLAKAA